MYAGFFLCFQVYYFRFISFRFSLIIGVLFKKNNNFSFQVFQETKMSHFKFLGMFFELGDYFKKVTIKNIKCYKTVVILNQTEQATTDSSE